MKKMLFLLFVLLPFFIQAQCECPSLPDDQTNRTVVNVSTVAQLDAALSDCNANNGNYTILLADGTYTLQNNLLYISDNMNNLTIRSASGNRDAVIIEGQGYSGNVSHIFNVAADHFTAADMTIGWVYYHAIQIQGNNDADNCLIQNIRFVNTAEQMLKVSGNSSSNTSDNGIVQCCLFEFPDGVAFQYYTGGIDAHSSNNWEVRHNTFRNIRSPDSGLAEHAIHFWSFSENTLVENNQIINCDRGIGFGLGDSGHSGGIIRNNLVHTTRDVGIGLESSPNSKVYHNTIITENYFNSIEYRFEATNNVHIANNLSNEAVTSRNDGTGLIESNFEITDLSIFEDAANFDYHLSAYNSQIVDAGIPLADVAMDYDCHLRDEENPDIGADEFDSTPSHLSHTENDTAFKIGPNPTRDLLIIESTQNGKAELWTYDGRLVHRLTISVGTTQINTSGWASGIYFFKIKTANNQYFKRVAITQ